MDVKTDDDDVGRKWTLKLMMMMMTLFIYEKINMSAPLSILIPRTSHTNFRHARLTRNQKTRYQKH